MRAIDYADDNQQHDQLDNQQDNQQDDRQDCHQNGRQDCHQDGQAHVLLGTVSARIDPATWQEFMAFRSAHPHFEHPLDSWGRRKVAALTAHIDGAVIHFPDSSPPFPLISLAAERFETLHLSPLGMLVSQHYGLMFGIRAWVSGPRLPLRALAAKLGLRDAADTAGQAPCATCPDTPCMSACPVGAFTATGFEVDACRKDLEAQRLGSAGPCWAGGCLARRACPYSSPYGLDQSAFHQRSMLGSFHRS